jgi:hypothetical protein
MRQINRVENKLKTELENRVENRRLWIVDASEDIVDGEG